MAEEDKEREIVCDDCETVPTLYETPYRDDTQYVLQCDCNIREIDVSEVVSASNLTDFMGKWANTDYGHSGHDMR